MHKCKQNAIFSTDNSIFSANCCCIAIFQRRKRKFVSVGKSIQHRTVDVLRVVLQDWQDILSAASREMTENNGGTFCEYSGQMQLIEQSVDAVWILSHVLKKKNFSLDIRKIFCTDTACEHCKVSGKDISGG